MKAIVVTKFGPPDVLKVREVAKPSPQDNEVLIRVFATTVSAGEVELRAMRVPIALRLSLLAYIRFMRAKPLILGQELGGEVEAVGNEVTRFKVGDQVFGWTGLRLGACAEFDCLPEKGVLMIKPPQITYQQAATLPIGGLDALYFIRKANIKTGEKVLIIGAGGSIGTYAVQLAKYFGAEVTAVDSAGKLDMLRSIGADHVIDYKREDYTGSSKTYDVIFDVVGKSSFSKSMRMLNEGGHYLLGNAPPLHLIRARRLSKRSGKKVAAWASRTLSQYKQDFDFLKELMEAGRVKSVIDKCFPIEQTAEAHRYAETGQKKGNIVITVGQKN